MRASYFLTTTIWGYSAVVYLALCESLESYGSLPALPREFKALINSTCDESKGFKAIGNADEIHRYLYHKSPKVVNLREKSAKPDSKKKKNSDKKPSKDNKKTAEKKTDSDDKKQKQNAAPNPSEFKNLKKDKQAAKKNKPTEEEGGKTKMKDKKSSSKKKSSLKNLFNKDEKGDTKQDQTTDKIKDKKKDVVGQQKNEKKPKKKPDKQDKKEAMKESNGPNLSTEDNRAIRIREHCKAPPNVFRTCYERAVDPISDVADDDSFELRNPFSQPFIDRDEWMVTDTMHLELSQNAVNSNDGEVVCKDVIALEELSLKYLKDNIGNEDSFVPICTLIDESAVENEFLNDGSGRVIQTFAFKIVITFAFKRNFAHEIEQQVRRYGLRHLIESRSLAGCNRGGYALCCSSHAFNSNMAKGSATCTGSGCGSGKCGGRKKKKKPMNSRSLFESNTLPDLYGITFDQVVGLYTVLKPEETRGILNAQSTDDVAVCAANRFIEDTLNLPSMSCQKYQEYNCKDNEDLAFFLEEECDSTLDVPPTISPTVQKALTIRPTPRPSAISPTTLSPTRTSTPNPMTINPTSPSPTRILTPKPSTTPSPTQAFTSKPTAISPTTSSPTQTSTPKPMATSPTTPSPTKTSTPKPTAVRPATSMPTPGLTSKNTTASPSMSPTTTNAIWVSGNDKCQDASPLVDLDLPAKRAGTTAAATPDFFSNLEPTCGTSLESKGVWFTLNSNKRRIVRLEYEPKEQWPGISVLSVFTGSCDIGAIKCTANVGSNGLTSYEFLAKAGETYRILLSGGNNKAAGEYEFRVTQYELPSNDECTDAKIIVTTPGVSEKENGNTLGATPDFTDTNVEVYACAGMDWYTRGVWYQYTGKGTNIRLEYQLYSTGIGDSELSIFTGSCGDLSCITNVKGAKNCLQYVACYLNFMAIHEFYAEKDTKYFFLLFGANFGAAAEYDFKVTEYQQ